MFVEQGSGRKADAAGQLLLDAADAIERYGWARGQYGDTSIGFCTEGALRFVWGAGDYDTLVEARCRLLAHLQYHEGCVEKWNDSVPGDKAQVVAALRAAATWRKAPTVQMRRAAFDKGPLPTGFAYTPTLTSSYFWQAGPVEVKKLDLVPVF